MLELPSGEGMSHPSAFGFSFDGNDMRVIEVKPGAPEDVIGKVWEFLGGKEAEMTDNEGRVYLWPTMGRIYKDDLLKLR